MVFYCLQMQKCKMMVEGEVSVLCLFDSLGKLLHAQGSPLEYIEKVLTVEANAFGKALEYAISTGQKLVKISSDAKNVC
ncbi:hypothetical protein EJD97_021698 [Solanum chilense]|uniref:Uncharacterized protein n=1 Tax=Solanum chilense TaxID=4083 RepID=A0A6N2CC65_SOLCI|nr:hypothetical protein EJD97_021698 [Solanum chilense]